MHNSVSLYLCISLCGAQCSGTCDVAPFCNGDSSITFNQCNVAYILNTAFANVPEGTSSYLPELSCGSGGDVLVPVVVVLPDIAGLGAQQVLVIQV